MNIKVTTQNPNALMRQARQLLRQRGQSKAQADALPDGKVDGNTISFDGLSETQFCALEDAAVRLQLEYDGTQEERPLQPASPLEENHTAAANPQRG